MSSSAVNGSNGGKKDEKAELTAAIEADVAELNELLSRDTLDDAGEASVSELLARLERADGMATGVEDKLDALLGNLNNLLGALETKKDVAETGSQPPPVPEVTDKKDEP